MKKALQIGVVILVVIVSIMGCKLSSDTTTTSVKVSKISASAESRSMATRDTVVDITTDTELWLMPTRRGWNEPIQSSNVFDIKKYSPNAQGEFIITGEDFPNSTFVIFVMDTNEINNGTDKIYKEAILGFLTLNSDDGPIIEFPPAHEIIGEISFGDVLITDDYYTTSTLGLEENRDAFTPDILEKLEKDMIIHNAGLMALNVLLNSNGIEFYCPSIDLKYEFSKDEIIVSANDINWGNIEIRVYSHDNTSTVGLFTPEGTQVGSYKESYGSGSATKWAFNIPMDTFKMYSESGNFWELRLNDGTTVLAEFDLSVAILYDENGVPIIPIPDPDIVYDSDTSMVESVTFNWFYFGSDGTTKYNLTDSDQVGRIIGYDEFCMQGYNSSSNLVSYMFREPHPEHPTAGGMQGDLITAHTLLPEIIEANIFHDMSYSFGLNGVQCQNVDDSE